MSNDPSKWWCIEYWKGANTVTDEEYSRCTIREHCGSCCDPDLCDRNDGKEEEEV